MLRSIARISRNVIPRQTRFCSTKNGSDNFNKLEESEDFEPVTLDVNPYKKDKIKCVLCRENIQLDYKNTRLLQQFVSSFSGRVYEQHVTGLCKKQYQAVVETIRLSRKAGYMPVMTKDPKYLRDPKLFDPMRPIRPHSYA
ncbi:unnamed protein product [Bursaphelenchus okinawaensis]|uniref:28S ribosomal protein S18c, mitochondrial n=1 Tax=Bursaphelenchus okinawaensis TaxID=465554 RepID=A0A811K987_9BILA|nr:unnamed protein product [Bursaphelenchus okinawaensis]CAG9095562.1 unnamed protein product [Bursaphelenchus okinawaensis]